MFLIVSMSYSIVCLIHQKNLVTLNMRAERYAEKSERKLYTARCLNTDMLYLNKNPRAEF